MRIHRRAAITLIAQTAAAVVGAACASLERGFGAPSPTATPTAPELRPVLANSEIVVGRNRFALGLIGPDNRPITDAVVGLTFFTIEGRQATKRSETGAAFRWIELEAKGLYVASAEFGTPGRWGVEIVATRPGRPPIAARVPFEVRERGSAPMIGTAAPRSKTPTEAEVTDLAEICSAVPACALHTVSVDTALGSGRPMVVLFASPGFCVSATCAPQLGVVQQVQGAGPDRANFVHVEVFKDPRNQVVTDAVTEWGLVSEPWVFLVDRAGAIVERYEGLVTAAELSSALEALG